MATCNKGGTKRRRTPRRWPRRCIALGASPRANPIRWFWGCRLWSLNILLISSQIEIDVVQTIASILAPGSVTHRLYSSFVSMVVLGVCPRL